MPQNNRQNGDQSDFRFQIVKHFGVLSTNAKGWTKEFNLVSWNGRDPKYDVRDWQPDHRKMSKGLTMTADEARELGALLEELTDGLDEDGDEEESHRAAA